MPTEDQGYQRVDTTRVGMSSTGPTAESADTGAADDGAGKARTGVRWTIIPLSILLCVTQAVVSIIAENTRGVILTSTLIPVLAFGVLLTMVLVLNPVLRAVFREKILRPLNRAELMCVFTALLVTSGISTFGLASQLVPLVGAPWNPEWNTPQRGWQEEVLPNLNRSLYLSVPEDGSPAERAQALDTIRQFRQGVQPTDAQGNVIDRPAESASFGEKADYWWAVFQDVPWGAWVGPLAGWLVFIGGCYAMFYCLTYVALGYWARREKLIFPLAQLPEQLLPDDHSRRWLPWTLTQSGFWIAFAVSFLFLSYNGAVQADWIPMERVGLGMSANTVKGILSDGAFEGLTGGQFSLQFLIIFTAIGVAFLLPTEISFSLWFYFLVGKVMILSLTWFGLGRTGADFPTNWTGVNNTVTAQGGGALLMFAGISLARAVGDIFHLGKGQTTGTKVRLCIPVIGLAISLAVIFGWLMWNDLGIVWALLITAFLTLLTMGMMRVVAEGGVYWFQLHTSPFHLYNTFGLGNVLASKALVPLVPIYSVLFLDVKTFLAPNLANAGKMQDDVGSNRNKFHINIILCIVISVLVALGFAVFLAHLQGAQQMHSWFYSRAPQSLMDRAQRMATAAPEFNGGNAFSYVFGAGWVVVSLLLRRTLFWFPHPIGYVMLLNPLMRSLWFSIFLGWIVKKIVVKYGGKQTFDKTRPIFIGLIIGELIAIGVWVVLGLWLNFSPGLSLNRYGP